jgi:hypothetical protein
MNTEIDAEIDLEIDPEIKYAPSTTGVSPKIDLESVLACAKMI